MKRYIMWFEEIRKEDVSLVGGKAANLGELTSNVDVPVPPGFAITADAYVQFLKHNQLDEKIMNMLSETDVNNTEQLDETSKKIRELIYQGEFPPDMKEEIINGYRSLGEKVGMENPYVATRSSATAEDLPDASFAGQQETYLDIRGEDELLDAVKKTFSSLYTPRAIFYRVQKGFAHEKVYLSCVVQKMVRSRSAGVMFTIDPVTGNPDVIVIEGSWGLGELVVKGSVNPDRFIVRKSDFSIEKKIIGRKEKMLVRGEKGTVEIDVPEDRKDIPCLGDEEVKKLADYAMRIERHYGTPQDIEWGLDEDTNELYILQSRAETVWSVKKEKEKRYIEGVTEREEGEKEIILKGLAASPGYAYGSVHVIDDVSKLKNFKEGEILVTKMTSPDWVPAMRKAKAIITDDGGLTCHAAIVSRELGIPSIVGSGIATKVLKDGMQITVDAERGIVYKGIIRREREEVPEKVPAAVPGVSTPVVTATKIYCNLGVPEKAEEVASMPFDGVGLMRIEFLISSYIGVHPLKLIEEGRENEYIDGLASGISKVGRAFYPRPVVMRFSDFKTNEYRELEGGEKYEIEENNPMLGWRGASRYTSEKFEPAFRLELRALKKVRDEYGLKNVWAMIPFCRTIDEIRKTIRIMEDEGLKRGKDFKVWLMCEIPSNVILVDEFSEFVDGFSIGSNDLTQLILGIDRDSKMLADIFDERDEAVKRAISFFIKRAQKKGRTVSICGQAPSFYPDFCEFLIRCGIDSISVNPDVGFSTRLNVAQIERKILLENSLNR